MMVGRFKVGDVISLNKDIPGNNNIFIHPFKKFAICTVRSVYSNSYELSSNNGMVNMIYVEDKDLNADLLCDNSDYKKEKKTPIQQRIEKISKEITDIVVKKNLDYGDSFSKMFKKFGMLSTVIRLNDKIGRLETLTGQDAKVDESVEDTLKDIVGYCLLTLDELRSE